MEAAVRQPAEAPPYMSGSSSSDELCAPRDEEVGARGKRRRVEGAC